MLGTDSVNTARPTRQARRHTASPTAASVAIGAAVVHLMRQAHGRARPGGGRQGGPDADVVLGRMVLWTAIEEARTGCRWVHASAERMAADFAARKEAAIVRKLIRRADGTDRRADGTDRPERIGMSARSLQRQRARFLETFADVTKDGRYKLKRPRTANGQNGGVHYLTMEQAEQLLFETTPAAFRAAVAALPILSIGRTRGTQSVELTGSQLAAHTKQSRSQATKGLRGARIAGLILDNYPGKKITKTPDPERPGRYKARHPARVVYLTSPIVPLTRGQIRSYTPAPTGPANSGEMTLRDMPNEARCLRGSPLRYEPEIRQPAEPAADEGASGAIAPAGSSGMTPETQPSAHGPRDGFADADHAATVTDGAALTKWTVAAVLRAAGVPGKCSTKNAQQIAAACYTAGTLRRILRDEAEGLRWSSTPIPWLAAILHAEGEAVRDPKWPGSSYRRQMHAKRTTPAAIAKAQWADSPEGQEAARRERARMAAQFIASQHGHDPAALQSAAAGLAESGQLEAAEAVRHRAAEVIAEQADAAARSKWAQMPPLATWPAGAAASHAVEPDAWEHRASFSALHVRWRGVGEAVIVGADETHTLLSHERYGQRLAAALAQQTGHGWRLIFEAPDGTRIGAAEAAGGTRDDDGLRTDRTDGPGAARPGDPEKGDGARRAPDRDGGRDLVCDPGSAAGADRRRPGAGGGRALRGAILDAARAPRGTGAPADDRGRRSDGAGVQCDDEGMTDQPPATPRPLDAKTDALSPRDSARAMLIDDLQRKADAGSASAALLLARFRDPTPKGRP